MCFKMFSSVLKCSIDVLLICSIDVLKMLSDVPGCYQMFQVVLRLLSIMNKKMPAEFPAVLNLDSEEMLSTPGRSCSEI